MDSIIEILNKKATLGDLAMIWLLWCFFDSLIKIYKKYNRKRKNNCM